MSFLKSLARMLFFSFLTALQLLIMSELLGGIIRESFELGREYEQKQKESGAILPQGAKKATQIATPVDTRHPN